MQEAHLETLQTVLGRLPEDTEDGIDVSPWLDESSAQRKQAVIFRHNKSYSLCSYAASGTQLNRDTMALGEVRPLSNGDVIVLGESLALEFLA